MKSLSALSILVVSALLGTACTPKVTATATRAEPPVHLAPDATTEELQLKLQTLDNKDQPEPAPEEQALYTLAFQVGSRLNLWIKNVNATRPAAQALALWTPDTIRGIPIDSGKDKTNYSVKETQAKLDALKTTAPKEMVDVVFGSTSVPSALSTPDIVFLQWGREFDRAYQTAMRLKMLLPYKDWYKSNRNGDVRGYYFLSRMPDLSDKLSHFSALSETDQGNFVSWLAEACVNTGETLEDCQAELKGQIADGLDLNTFYNKYSKAAQAKWNEYFDIPSEGVRKDIVWTTQNLNLMQIPFLKTAIQEVNDYLSVNIQDEWKWGSWQLELAFKNTGKDIPHVVFEPGATPHVDGIGGNMINMDALTNLQGWDSRWTIRHEFGHVLGFPDCYVEFFEEESGDMVNYQLDISDLMCSRKGKLKERHYLELKRVYSPEK